MTKLKYEHTRTDDQFDIFKKEVVFTYTWTQRPQSHSGTHYLPWRYKDWTEWVAIGTWHWVCFTSRYPVCELALLHPRTSMPESWARYHMASMISVHSCTCTCILYSQAHSKTDKLNQWMAGGNAGKSSPSPCSTGWICWVKAGQLQVSYHQCGQHTVNQNHKSHPLFLTSMENKYFTGTQRKCWSCWQRTFFNSFQRKFGNKPSSRCLKKVGKKRS